MVDQLYALFGLKFLLYLTFATIDWITYNIPVISFHYYNALFLNFCRKISQMTLNSVKIKIKNLESGTL